MSAPSQKLPDVRDLHTRWLHSAISHTLSANPYWEAMLQYVERGAFPPVHLALRLAHAGIEPTTTRERYLLRVAIAAIRVHEDESKRARTKLADMRARIERCVGCKRTQQVCDLSANPCVREVR